MSEDRVRLRIDGGHGIASSELALRVLDVTLVSAATRRPCVIDPSARFSTAQQVTTYLVKLCDACANVNGVEAAGVTDALPFGRNRAWLAGTPRGWSYKRGEYPFAFVHIVSDGYLKAMGIPLRAGRDFSERDTTATESVIMINGHSPAVSFPARTPLDV